MITFKKILFTAIAFTLVPFALAMEEIDQLLLHCAQQGYEAGARELIELGANVNWAAENGVFPLIVAAQNGHLGVVKILLENGASINVQGAAPNHTFALFNAAMRGHDQIVQLLLKKGECANRADARGVTPLMVASEHGHLGVVHILLDHGANVNTQAAGMLNVFALKQAAQEGEDAIAQLLLEKGALVNMVDEKGLTPLIHASQNGHLGIVRILLNYGANVNTQAAGLYNVCALRQAAHNGRLGVVETLLTFIPEADGKAMRGKYFALAHSMKKKSELCTSPDTRRLVLKSFITALGQKRIDGVVLPMVALCDSSGRSARDVAQAQNHTGIANLLDLSNSQSREKIRSMIEANVRGAIQFRAKK